MILIWMLSCEEIYLQEITIMNELIKDIEKYQKENKEVYFLKIYNRLDKIISYKLQLVKDKEDVKQLIYLNIILFIRKFKIKEIETKDNYDKFIKENKEKNCNLKNEFKYYCNEKQFLKYFNKIIDTTIKKYYRDNKKHKNNLSINDNIDISSTSNISLKDIFLKKDYEFLFNFIENDTLLTEQEVAKKLGITQQAVNKRKKKICKKYKNLIEKL